jgi:hypothetical protein
LALVDSGAVDTVIIAKLDRLTSTSMIGQARLRLTSHLANQRGQIIGYALEFGQLLFDQCELVNCDFLRFRTCSRWVEPQQSRHFFQSEPQSQRPLDESNSSRFSYKR